MSWQPPDEIRFRSNKLRKFIVPILIIGGLAALGAAQGWGWYVMAATFGFCVWVSWSNQPNDFTLRIFSDGFDVRPSGLRIPFADITEIRLSNRSVINQGTVNGAPLFVIGYSRGRLHLPHHDAIDRVGLYDWLVGKTTLLNEPETLPGLLDEVRAKEIEDFGANQVFATKARAVAPAETKSPNLEKLWIFTIILFFAALTAAILQSVEPSRNLLMGCAIVLFFFALLFEGIRRGKRRVLEKTRSNSGLVISPRSLTIESQFIKGMMRWSEVKEMTIMARQAGGLTGLLLKIEGGQFMIGDHYESPLTEIHRRIESYLAHER